MSFFFAIRSPLARALMLSAGLIILNGCDDNAPAATARPLQAVAVYHVTRAPQALSTTLPGRASAHLVAEIRPQVGGILLKRLFVEGETVKAGQALYQIDPQTYEAAVAQAEATVSSASATLKASELKARRDADLVKIDAISAEDNESAQSTLLQNRASLQSAQAALRTARINLGYTRINAPIAGRTDTSSVTPGALVTAEQTTALTTVQQLDPIYVDFTSSGNWPRASWRPPSRRTQPASACNWRTAAPMPTRAPSPSTASASMKAPTALPCAPWCRTRTVCCCRACTSRRRCRKASRRSWCHNKASAVTNAAVPRRW